MKARIAGQPTEERRNSERRSVSLDAQVREMGAEGCEAQILNLSEDGFMAEVAGVEFEVGSRVWLILPDRERASALVRWTAGDKLGAQFAEPIDLGQVVPENED